MNSLYSKSFIPYFLMLPSIFIGILAMITYGVPSSIWSQNIIVWLLGTVFGFIYLTLNKKKHSNKGNVFYTIFLIVLLGFPFLFNGLDGVHRWVTFGPINIYVASIILPVFIIHLWKLAVNHHELHVTGATFFVLAILLFQPDAGQVTAFACAVTMILWKEIRNRTLKLMILTFTTSAVIMTWTFLDDLAAVPYVEHIIFLAANMGNLYFILGIFSLLLLLLPFFLFSKTTIASSLGIYFLIMMIVTFFGHFPMPIMGHGISPVIGYLIAITWVNETTR